MEKQKNSKNGLLKLTILSISLMISAASAISVTLPMIKNQFPDISAATVESLVTIPSFSMMIFILLSSLIIKTIGRKKTVVLGLVLAFIGGVIPAFVTNFQLIFLSRLILGAGTGIYNSLAISLIGDHFEGETQQKMLGYQTAFSTLGTSFVTFLAGILVSYSWHYSYLVYFFTLPVVVMVTLFLPQDKKESVKEDNVPKGKQTVNSLVIFSCVMMFLFFVLVMNIYTKTSTLIVDENYANQGFLGTTLTIGSLIGAVGGFLYSHIKNLFKGFTPVLALCAVAIAYFLVPHAGNMTVLTIILTIGFLVVSLFIPYMYDILLPGAPENSSNLAVSLAMVSCNLGSFFSPYIIQALGSLVGNTTSAFSFTIGGIIFAGMAVVFLLINVTKSKSMMVTTEK
ncbi:MFS transporter [Enterococcus hulanensis]|uniref:MFS transporter n=1 Tax=Enterococcus hulanensis TaxID=2559929 RepID=UPI001A8DA6AC|nr:MFS transporter [Enterococcus hulanensis]MBO0458169.1 MFS transporter [Enterococcus hulanensis]